MYTATASSFMRKRKLVSVARRVTGGWPRGQFGPYVIYYNTLGRVIDSIYNPGRIMAKGVTTIRLGEQARYRTVRFEHPRRLTWIERIKWWYEKTKNRRARHHK
jgi:hypothetical protein